MAVLADIKKDRDKAILEKKHWDESVDKWRESWVASSQMR